MSVTPKLKWILKARKRDSFWGLQDLRSLSIRFNPSYARNGNTVELVRRLSTRKSWEYDNSDKKDVLRVECHDKDEAPVIEVGLVNGETATVNPHQHIVALMKEINELRTRAVFFNEIRKQLPDAPEENPFLK